jgi:oxygen-independent coproporphyrinogen-3 oxidase
MACKHNLQYWRGLPYLAFGAGAHGYANGYRYSNVLRIKTYIDRFGDLEPGLPNVAFPFSPASVNQRRQSREDDISDYMITNLRLVRAGVSGSDFRSRFGCGLQDVYPREVEELIHAGLLEKETSENSEVFRLTKRGRLLGNQVFMRFVGD